MSDGKVKKMANRNMYIKCIFYINYIFYWSGRSTNNPYFFYTIKPLKKDAVLVIDIKCPLCNDIERVVILQYSSEESRKKFLESPDELDLNWTPIIDNNSID